MGRGGQARGRIAHVPWLVRAIVYGGLAAGALDLLDAFVFFGLRSGARPMGILHSIAAGPDGTRRGAGRRHADRRARLRSAFPDRACIIAAIYVVASRVSRCCRRRWVICGLAYGVVAYFVMTFVVVPLSNAGPGRIAFALPVTPVLINGLAIHAFGVGLPIAYFASRRL